MFKISNNKILVGIIIIYVAIMLYLIYYSYDLSNKLIFDLQVLSLSDYENTASGPFIILNLISILALIIGLFAILTIHRSESAQIIYVEKTEEENANKKKSGGQQAEKIEVNLEDYFKGKSDNVKASLNFLNTLCENIDAAQALLYLGKGKKFELAGGYALYDLKERTGTFESGEGLTGQVAAEKEPLILNELDKGHLTVASGLGETEKVALGIFPLLKGKKVLGVVEIARFKAFNKEFNTQLMDLFEKWADKLDTPVKSSASKKSAAKTKNKQKDQ